MFAKNVVFTFSCTESTTQAKMQGHMKHPVSKALETYPTDPDSFWSNLQDKNRSPPRFLLSARPLNDDLDGCGSGNGSQVNRANESIHSIGTMADAFMAPGDIS